MSYPHYPQPLSHGGWPPYPTQAGPPSVAPQYATPAWPRGVPAGALAGPGLPNPGRRLGARLIDLVGWQLLILAGGTVDALLTDPYGSAGPWIFGLWIPVSAIVYFVVPLANGGSTLGKRVCRLRVVRIDGTAVGFLRALGREAFWLFGNLVPLLNWINPLSCLWDKPLQQCTHDKVARTYVVGRVSKRQQ